MPFITVVVAETAAMVLDMTLNSARPENKALNCYHGPRHDVKL